MTSWWRKISPAWRLTAAYMVIIMAISLFFSVALYRVSSNQLRASLRRQYLRFNPFSYDYQPVPPVRVQDELEAGEHSLRTELVYFNLVILGLGGAASYWLARRTLQPIEDALEAQSRFTADASHELRTPLTAMQTEIEVALRDPKLGAPAARKLLQSNLEEVAKLRTLSDGLLRLASSDGKELLQETVALKAVVEKALSRVAKTAEKRQISFEDQTSNLVLKGDEHSLAEVLVTLLDNAVKYSDPGTKVIFTSRTNGKFAELRIKDQGYGIKASDLPHVFDRFYRADSSRSKDKVDGYGLGLSIAKKLVELHGGTISVTSRAGQGSTFIVRLPLTRG